MPGHAVHQRHHLRDRAARPSNRATRSSTGTRSPAGGAGQAYGSRPTRRSPGYGRWIHTSLVELFQRLRQDCDELSPDFALSMEEPGELYVPYLQLIQSRPYVITSDFPR